MDLILNTRFSNPRLPWVERPGFVDDFDRPSADTLGETLDGKTWTVYDASTSTSVWGTTGNGTATMKSASFGYHIAAADALTADGELECVLSTRGPGSDHRFGLAVRVVDSGNFIFVAAASTTDHRLRLQNRVDGSLSTVGSASNATLSDGDVVRVRAEGTLISVFVNGSQVISENISDHASGTKHGIYAFTNTTGEWDSATFTPLEG